MAITKDEEIAFRGYNEITEDFIPRKGLEDTIAKINEAERIKICYQIHKMSKKEALKDTKIFYKHFFKIHNVLFYSTHKVFKYQFFTLTRVSPFKLPIKLIPYTGDISEGSVIENLIPDLKPIATFRGIILTSPYTEHTPISYTHELMHTQIDSIAGSVTDYYDAEVMSIFIELVFTFYCSPDERLLNLEDKRRIYEIAQTLESIRAYLIDKASNLVSDTDLLNEEVTSPFSSAYNDCKTNIAQNVRTTILENTKYLISDLKAYALFITFYFSKDTVKKEMLSNVQSVLDSNLTVKDFLKLYDVNTETMQDEKRLLKYFKR